MRLLARHRRPVVLLAALAISTSLPIALAGCDAGAKEGTSVPVSDDAMKKKAEILQDIRQKNIDAHKKGGSKQGR